MNMLRLSAVLFCASFIACCFCQGSAASSVEGGYKVTTVVAEPYLKQDVNSSDNATTFTGFIPDLMKEVARVMQNITDTKFQYTLVHVADGMYGAINASSGKWTGMIGEIADGKANIAAAPLMITIARDAVIDFTWPFLSVTASVVFKRRSSSLKPLNNINDILSVTDTSSKHYTKLGVMSGGPIETHFRTARARRSQDIWRRIEQDRELTVSLSEGFLKASREQNFAFIVDSPTADYMIYHQPCDLQAFSLGSAYKRYYALVVPEKSPLVSNLTRAIVELDYEGTIDDLYVKWFQSNPCSGNVVSVTLNSLLFVAVINVALIRAVFC